MKYLVRGAESAARINCLLAFTKIDSDSKVAALHDHFVKGREVCVAANLNEIPQSKLSKVIVTLNEIAGLCERFYDVKQYEINKTVKGYK